ncbi:unnamed protein product [Nippostrongylus brasiliensis]|uniref:Transposase n=1 Tax=Nippostrongylus brasiliensis TaxID=27835 RepID=A0A0N4YDU1_NIPBR|nr:unnamed protein product [Nippostrongylus brasiliensis]
MQTAANLYERVGMLPETYANERTIIELCYIGTKRCRTTATLPWIIVGRRPGEHLQPRQRSCTLVFDG